MEDISLPPVDTEWTDSVRDTGKRTLCRRRDDELGREIGRGGGKCNKEVSLD